MTVLPIRLFPDPVLRVRCRAVERFDPRLRALVSDMVETMYAAPGVGLAAPQVGVEERVAVIDPSVGDDPDALLVLVNPEITVTDGTATEAEGCLSIPEFQEKVTRHASLSVRAHDADGQPVAVEATGILARVIQHELDHLDGVLFVDRLTGLRRDRARRFLKRLLEVAS